MTQLTIAMLQAKPTSQPSAEVIAELSEAMTNAAALGADVLVTPELFLSGYGCPTETAERAQTSNSPLLLQAAQLSAKHRIALVLGYPEKTDRTVYNSAIVFDKDGATLHNYRKINLPNEYERGSFSWGTEVKVFEISGVRAAVLICSDVEFPELTRRAAEMGAEVLLVPTALNRKWRIVPESVIPVRAFENGFFVAYCNFGSDFDSPNFAGLSTICGPEGQVLVRAGHSPELIVTSIDTDQILDARFLLSFLSDVARMRSMAQFNVSAVPTPPSC
jgi:5-aminopentanamidase